MNDCEHLVCYGLSWEKDGSLLVQCGLCGWVNIGLPSTESSLCPSPAAPRQL